MAINMFFRESVTAKTPFCMRENSSLYSFGHRSPPVIPVDVSCGS